ncbi:MAG: DUF302 domain-containing protein [Acetobacteraceae bacterium]|nr:DUF302 domain-containing protein [Acetobacteraceae bacterium]
MGEAGAGLRSGHPIILATSQLALELPLCVLVRQREDGQTTIAYHPIVPLLRRTGVAPELAARLEPAQRLLILHNNPRPDR